MVELNPESVGPRVRSAELRVALGKTDEAEQLVAGLVSGPLSAEVPKALIELIEQLKTDAYTETSRLEWVRIWKEAAADRDDYQVALRMLEKAVEYLNTGNRAALLALPSEERSIVAPLVGWTEFDNDDE